MSSVRRHATFVWALPLSGAVLAVAYVLNAGLELGVHPASMARPMIVGAAAAAAITGLLVALTRNRDRGGAAAAIVLALTVAGGAIGTVVTRTEWWQATVWLALVLAAVLLLTRIALRERRRRRLIPTTGTLNIFATAMLGTVIAFGAVNGNLAAVIASSTLPLSSTSGTSTDPDIVVIMLDGYPRADVLERIFEHDNSSFLDALGERGFTVAERAESNYAWTELTVLSMLHMRHAPEIPAFETGAASGKSQPWLRDLTGDNPVFDHVRDQGYRVISISNNMDHTTLRGADLVMTPPGYSDFELHLLGATALAGAIGLIDPAFAARNHREQVLWGLDTIERQATTDPGGRLLIGHVLSPHLPAVLHRDGSLRPVRYDHTFYMDFRALVGTPRDEWNAAFRDQVAYLNQRIVEVVDRIVEENADATVIVMSDHGSGSDYRADDPDSDIDERYSILFAARNPGGEQYPDDVTPVNVFQPLLGERFGLDHPLRRNTRFVGYLELGEVPGGAE